jgi:hypothetical protein
MEVEYFIPPGDDVWQPFHEQWMKDSKEFLWVLLLLSVNETVEVSKPYLTENTC